MKRNEHTFQFTGRQIATAASAENIYHTELREYWKGEQQLAIAKAKSAGIDVREYDVTGGKAVNIVVDPEVSSRLTTCANKINSHRTAADRFQVEAAAYATQAERTYELQPDDVLYFRLAGGARDD